MSTVINDGSRFSESVEEVPHRWFLHSMCVNELIFSVFLLLCTSNRSYIAEVLTSKLSLFIHVRFSLQLADRGVSPFCCCEPVSSRELDIREWKEYGSSQEATKSSSPSFHRPHNLGLGRKA